MYSVTTRDKLASKQKYLDRPRFNSESKTSTVLTQTDTGLALVPLNHPNLENKPDKGLNQKNNNKSVRFGKPTWEPRNDALIYQVNKFQRLNKYK